MQLTNKAMFFLLIFFSLYFIYSPAIQIPFAHHDQYRYFVQDKSHAKHDSQYEWLKYVIGRPGAAIIEQVVFKNTFVLKDLKFFRLCCIICISLLVLASTYWLQTRSFSLLESFFISGAIFTLPAIQNFLIMTNLANLFTIGLTFTSYFFFIRRSKVSWQIFHLPKYFIWGSNILLSSSCLLAALLTYPFLAYAFLLPFFADLLFQKQWNWEKLRNITLKPIIFIFINSLVYFFIVKMALQPKAPVCENQSYNFSLSFSFFERFIFLLKEIYPMASHFWDIYLIKLIPYLVGFAIIISCVLKYFELKKDSVLSVRVLYFVSFIVFIFLSIFIYIIKKPDFLLHRLFFVFSSMLFISLVYLCKNLCSSLPKIRLILLGAGFCMGSCFANWNVSQTALTANMEVNYITSQIVNSPIKEIKRIHYVVPSYDTGFTGHKTITDEFNVPTTCWFQDLSHVTGCILKYLNDPRHVNVTATRTGEPFEIGENTVVIYMESLKGCR